MLALAAPAAHAAEWHRVSTSQTLAGCNLTFIALGYGGWPTDRLKCELDGPWSPWQTYGGYVYY
ncbi:hypothetical protein NE236_30185 [Actinoallomurus purpureus]|uniref:hypothetical protein n=1 Tax=Actinoallomurus purpureus TaxID=478114 RepID=UPI0020932608|nr:hypothetical protein [Actinoallomurus purpureus]MCO6009248.1 hypothetical protein [Actinoallomurus purpureus]